MDRQGFEQANKAVELVSSWQQANPVLTLGMLVLIFAGLFVLYRVVKRR